MKFDKKNQITVLGNASEKKTFFYSKIHHFINDHRQTKLFGVHIFILFYSLLYLF